MRRTRNILALALVFTLPVGCGLRRPFERPPGTVDTQRQEASRHDPYVDNDAGPEVVGGRPREFNKPWAEPRRNGPQQQLPLN